MNRFQSIAQLAGNSRKPVSAWLGSAAKISRGTDRLAETVARAHHRMAEPVGRRRELERHVRVVLPVEELEIRLCGSRCCAVVMARCGRTCAEHVVVDDRRQKVVQHDPLIVEAHLALHHGERPVRVSVGDFVVKPVEQPLQLRDDDVFVVAWIADDGAPLQGVGDAAPRQVARAGIGRGARQRVGRAETSGRSRTGTAGRRGRGRTRCRDRSAASEVDERVGSFCRCRLLAGSNVRSWSMNWPRYV